MRVTMYHGATKVPASAIVSTGYINAGCFCIDKNRAKIYAMPDGVIFTFKKYISISEYARYVLSRVLFKIFGKAQGITVFLMDHDIFPIDFEEYVGNIFTETTRKIKWDKCENINADTE